MKCDFHYAIVGVRAETSHFSAHKHRDLGILTDYYAYPKAFLIIEPSFAIQS
jgi:hypothetical protein